MSDLASKGEILLQIKHIPLLRELVDDRSDGVWPRFRGAMAAPTSDALGTDGAMMAARTGDERN